MNTYKVTCNEKKGYWLVSAESKEEAIYECIKGNDQYTNVVAEQRN